MKHAIHAKLLTNTIKVTLVGAGGTGSQVLTGLARLDRAIRACGHPYGLHVTTYDPDCVSESNVGRQLFAPDDIGLNKAVVLTHRLNMFYGLAWEGIPDRPFSGFGSSSGIVITCVDSAKSRREIHKSLNVTHKFPTYWLDIGNRARDGQVILGETLSCERGEPYYTASSQHFVQGEVKKRRRKAKTFRAPRLPMVTELYPELLDESLPEDDAPTCSLAEALERQDLFVNQSVATWGLNLLWRLLRQGGLDECGYFINMESGVVNPLPVPETTPAKKKAT